MEFPSTWMVLLMAMNSIQRSYAQRHAYDLVTQFRACGLELSRYDYEPESLRHGYGSGCQFGACGSVCSRCDYGSEYQSYVYAKVSKRYANGFRYYLQKLRIGY